MKHLESQLQQSCVRWFRYQFAAYKRLLFAIPNGGKRNKITAAILNAEGVVAGVPDLFLAVPRKGFHGMFIEMKSGSNDTTDSQKYMIHRLQGEGYDVKVINDAEEFQRIVTNYLR